jgi:glycosyltransferase involved in cell wall biosynthesis
MQEAGFKILPLRWRRKQSWPWAELLAIWEIIRIYRDEKPHLVHHVALKPVVYGSIAARITRIPGVVNAVAGLGFVFVSKRPLARILRPVLKASLKFSLKGSRHRTIVQNPNDRDFIKREINIDSSRISLIRGSGVDLRRFVPTPEPACPPLTILASRLIKEKGIVEYAEAAGILKKRGINARFALLGAIDKENPSAIPEKLIEEWIRNGWIEWQGYKHDMPSVLANCHIVCLPSFYGEGIPKILIEAAACARPIVTTDVPGCREIVKHNQNGFLVPTQNVQALADALQTLIEAPELRREMGQKSREFAQRYFSIEKVIKQTIEVYRELMEHQ